MWDVVFKVGIVYGIEYYYSLYYKETMIISGVSTFVMTTIIPLKRLGSMLVKQELSLRNSYFIPTEEYNMLLIKWLIFFISIEK